MSKLTLPILCAYLPYKVELNGCNTRLNTTVVQGWIDREWDIELLLRPLSSLTKSMKELDGKTPMEAVKSALWNERYGWPRIWLDSEYTEGKHGIVLVPTDSGISIRCVPDYYMIPQSAFEIVRSTLLSLHMDIFGLLESGDALPIEEDGK